MKEDKIENYLELHYSNRKVVRLSEPYGDHDFFSID